MSEIKTDAEGRQYINVEPSHAGYERILQALKENINPKTQPAIDDLERFFTYHKKLDGLCVRCCKSWYD